MGNNKTEADGAASTVVAGAAPVALSINEFCTRLSETVIRPELIGAFAFSERAAGNLRDTADAYQARYEAFVNKPV